MIADSLTLDALIRRYGVHFPQSEIITYRADGTVDRINAVEFAQIAHGFASAALPTCEVRGVKVATLAWNNSEHLAGIVGLPASGATVVPLNPRSSISHLIHVLGAAEVAYILVQPELEEVGRAIVDSCGKAIEMWPLPRIGQLAKSCGNDRNWPIWRSDDEPDGEQETRVAQVGYTSGTTGMPKLIAYTHRSQILHAMMVATTDSVGIGEADCVLPAVPFFHANSQGLPLASLFTGSRVVLADSRSGDGAFLARLAREERVSCLGCVPTQALRVCADLEGDASAGALDGVRIVCGGSAVSQALWERVDALGGTMIQVWGMTETSPIVLVSRPRPGFSHAEAARHGATVGRPVAGVEIAVRDLSSGTLLPAHPGTVGELACRGPWVAAGYLWGASADPVPGWLLSGDLVEVDDEGFVVLKDRIKDLVKSGGEWIPGAELEDAMRAHEEIADCAIIGVPNDEWGERPLAFIQLNAGSSASIHTISRELEPILLERFPKYWLPDGYYQVAELPRGSTGKIDKRLLKSNWRDYIEMTS